MREEPVRKTACVAPDLARPACGLRRLHAIEIAEGALLADIAVVFQLLIRYLPIGGTFLALLTPVVFAVIVLRRGLYVGCMSLCVALCLIGIVLGPGGLPLVMLEAGAGLFLGTTMRHRLNQLLTVTLGILSGSLALWLVLLVLVLLLGGPQFFLRVIRQTYAALTPLVGLLFKLAGLGAFWGHTLLPWLDSFVLWGQQHWPILLLLAAWGMCIPLVVIVYVIVNACLRLLGYQVRPFLGYRLSGRLYWLAARLYRLCPRWAYARFPLLHQLRCQVRLLNRARLRQRREEKEADSEHESLAIDRISTRQLYLSRRRAGERAARAERDRSTDPPG
jgi:uncharacterized protein YybS (DUF2232 family)